MAEEDEEGGVTGGETSLEPDASSAFERNAPEPPRGGIVRFGLVGVEARADIHGGKWSERSKGKHRTREKTTNNVESGSAGSRSTASNKSYR